MFTVDPMGPHSKVGKSRRGAGPRHYVPSSPLNNAFSRALSPFAWTGQQHHKLTSVRYFVPCRTKSDDPSETLDVRYQP
jgi:hypothetical protein